jgi:hypothetical protein
MSLHFPSVENAFCTQVFFLSETENPGLVELIHIIALHATLPVLVSTYLRHMPTLNRKNRVHPKDAQIGELQENQQPRDAGPESSNEKTE